MIRMSIAAAALVLAAAATPSFAGPYDNDGSSLFDAFGGYHTTYDRTADGDNCGFHHRWGSYGRRLVRRTYEDRNGGRYVGTYEGRNDGRYVGANEGRNYGSNYGRRDEY